ncbi:MULTISPECIES: NUDIX hydrolase [Propionimicrobium]|uniref:NUDIX hydrolase n=1 Tax=Propionimicrobium TaxID=203133 RepID=UPI00056160E1|nr:MULTISPECIES: NUDIX domain-containing protein [Propionimicrobium]
MRIIGVTAPGAPISVSLHVDHGLDPKMMLWRSGYVISKLLSANLIDDEIVITAQVAGKTQRTKPPRYKARGVDPQLVVQQGEKPIVRQRIAAYAIVRSKYGVLGTVCSPHESIPDFWQLPGGGVELGESPSEGVLREINEETAQSVELDRLIDIQSDHWVGRAPNGTLEDFQAVRIVYSATCKNPTKPRVLEVGGTTSSATWVPANRWRHLAWSSWVRSMLDKHLSEVPEIS